MTANEMEAGPGLGGVEVLDEIKEWIWLSYGDQIQQELRRDRFATTSVFPPNLYDAAVPF